MTKWPWQSFDPVDGGRGRTTQKGEKLSRGFKIVRLKPGKNDPLSTPGWVKATIDDVSPVSPAKPEKDTRHRLEKKHDIREIDGRRVAHVTPEGFRALFIQAGALKALAQEASKIVISDGVNLSAEFKFAGAYPAPSNINATLTTRDLIQQGIVGALKSAPGARVFDGLGRKELGYLIRGDVAPQLAAHGSLLAQGATQNVVRHSSTEVWQGGNLLEVFASAAALKALVNKTPTGVFVSMSGRTHDGNPRTVSLGCVFPFMGPHSWVDCTHHTSVPQFREGWVWKFMAASNGQKNLQIEETNGLFTPVADVKGVILYRQVHRTAGPLGDPIAIFIPAAHLPASAQSPDPAL